MYACCSVSVASRPADKRRRRGEIGSIRRSILVGQEKYLVKSKDRGMAFVDLEKVFDRVPQEVVWFERDLMAQRLARRAEDRDGPGSSPTQD